MGDASYIQTSFLGGEFSPLIQGRMDDPRYRTGMNVCRNALPLEEGSAARRPGTRLIGPTRKGAKAVLRAFDFQQSHPYNLELTAGHMRFLAGAGIVVDAVGAQVVSSVSTANPAVVGVPVAHGWSTGDEVTVRINPGEVNSTIAALLGRQLEITVVDTKHFSVADAVTGVTIDGTAMVLGSSDLIVNRISDFVTPYGETDLPAINQVQDQTDLLLLHNKYPPQAVISTSPEQGSSFAVFTFGAGVFKDGPYLDPPKDGTTITSSGLSGSVTLTLAGGSTVFAATDVGRLVRLFSEPAAWAVGTAYAVGNQVAYNGGYYQALKANTGNTPDSDVVNWGVSSSAAAWTWAIITAFTDTTHVTATLQAPILRTTACTTWRLGLFSQKTGYPSCGTYHEGRLWLAGVIGNRLDGSVSNDFFNFSPTAVDGTVADNNAIAAVFNAKDVNQIYWMEPDGQGIVCGTQAGEWLVAASAQNDPLTPTSIQAHRRTNYGCANVPAKRTGITISFVQRFQKKLLEYITTDFRGLSAHNIALTGKHLTQKGIVELAYQAEKVPTIWARTADNALISCTYKRESPYASDPPVFSGWAHHDLGGGYTVESIQAGPNYDGSLDALSIVVSDGTHRWVNLVTDLFDVDWTIGDAQFVDFAEAPSMAEIITGPPKVIRLYSLHYLAGKNVDVFAAGIDCGTLTVASDGHLDIPIDSTTIPLLTSAWLAGLNSATNFHGLGIAITTTPPGLANAPTLTGMQQISISTLATDFNGGFEVDWDQNRVCSVDDRTDTYVISDITTFSALTPVIAPTAYSFATGFKFGEDGFLYTAQLSINSGTLNKVDPITGNLLTKFGLATSGFQFSTTLTTWAAPSDMDTLKVDGVLYLVSTALAPLNTIPNNQISVLNLGANLTDAIAWDGQTYGTAETVSYVTRGLPVFGVGVAWVVAWGRNNATPTQELGFALYRVTIAGGVSSMVKTATILGSAVGHGWTHISSLNHVCLDETDGNIITHVSEIAPPAWSSATTYAAGDIVSNVGHDFNSLVGANINNAPTVGGTVQWQDLGVTGPAETRIIKINVHSNAVMWSVPIARSELTNSTRIRNGRYTYMDGNGANAIPTYINTLTGAFTVGSNLGNFTHGGQITNDYTGEIIFSVNYLNNGTCPPIGTTPTGFVGLATLGPAAGPAYPAALPPAAGVVETVPVAIGFTYPTQGQILRVILPQEAGSQNGPALGKTRRTHMYAALLQQTQGIKIGTDFSSARVAQLRSKGGVPLPLTTLFSAVHQDSLQDDYSFDSMLCWEIDRPYPGTVCTLGAFVHTQDR